MVRHGSAAPTYYIVYFIDLLACLTHIYSGAGESGVSLCSNHGRYTHQKFLASKLFTHQLIVVRQGQQIVIY